ncbi:c-type cytochrome [Paracoccaceae bacterium GXU_MW_L88]
MNLASLTRAATALSLLAIPSFAQDFSDPALIEEGEAQFRKCRACHMVGEDAQKRSGPALNGMVGGPVAASEAFADSPGYSPGMLAFAEENPVWTPDLLNAYLEKPRDLVEGTKMVFVGLREQEERDAMIAYLASFSPDFVPEASGEAGAETPEEEPAE